MGHIKKPFLLKSFNEIMTIVLIKKISTDIIVSRGGYRAPATSKMERFVIIVYAWKPLTIITKRSILNVAAALDSPLDSIVGILAYLESCQIFMIEFFVLKKFTTFNRELFSQKIFITDIWQVSKYASEHNA